MKRFYTGFEGPWTNIDTQTQTIDFPHNYLKSMGGGYVTWYRDSGAASQAGQLTMRTNALNSSNIRAMYDPYAPTIYSLSANAPAETKKGTAFTVTNPYETGGLAFAISAYRDGFFGKWRCSWHSTNPSSTYTTAFCIIYTGASSNDYGIRVTANSVTQTMALSLKGTVIKTASIPNIVPTEPAPYTNRATPYDIKAFIRPTGELSVTIAGVTLEHDFGWNPLSAAGEIGNIYIGCPGRGSVQGYARIDDVCINDGAVKVFVQDLGGTGYGAQAYASLSAGPGTTTVKSVSVTDGGQGYTGPLIYTLHTDSFTLPFSADPFTTINSGVIENSVSIVSGGTDIVGKDVFVPSVFYRGYNWNKNLRDVYNAGFEKSGANKNPATPADSLLDYDFGTRARSLNPDDEVGYMLATDSSFLSTMSLTDEISFNMWMDSVLENVDSVLTTRIGLTGATPTLSASIVNLPYPMLPYISLATTHFYDQDNNPLLPVSLSSLQASIKVLNP